MSSYTGNPYHLPKRISFWRDFFRDIAWGRNGLADCAEDVGPDVANWGLNKAEEVAAVVWECLDARGQEDALANANDAAERWLMMLDQLVDAGKLGGASRDAHRLSWTGVKVTHD